MKSAVFSFLRRVFLLFIGFQPFFLIDVKAQFQWTQIEGIYSGEVSNMFVQPATNDIVLTTERKIYKWYASNRTWKPLRINFGFDPTIQYAGTGSENDLYFGWSNKVFYSHDFGENWQSQDILPPASGSIISICGTEDGRVLAIATSMTGAVMPEIYFSSNRAVSWTTMLSNIHFYPREIIFEEENALFMAATDKGVWKSEDNGVTWLSMNQGPMDETQNVQHLHLVKNTGTLLASTSQNVFRSDNGGQIWTKIPETIPGRGDFDDDGAGNIYKTGEENGLYVSTDDGQTWVERWDAGMPAEVNMVRIGNNNSLFISGRKNPGLLLYDEGLEKWKQEGVPEFAINAIYPASNSDVVLVATDDTLYRSIDKGMSWQRANEGIDHRFFIGLGQYGNELVAMSVFEGFYFSSDSGESWIPNKGPLPTSIANSMISTNSNKIFITNPFSSQVLMSHNKGLIWASYMQGLPAQTEPNNLLFLQRSGQPGYLYCDAPFGKVYRTLINAPISNWQPYYNGLPDNLMFGLFGSLDGNTLLTYGSTKIYKTSTLSDQWVGASLPPSSQTYLSAFLAIDDLRWIAGTEEGIYFTINGGQNWQLSNDGLLDVRIRSLQINQDGLVMAGTEDGGLYYSEGLMSSIISLQPTSKGFTIWPNPAHDYVIVKGVDVGANDWFATDVLGLRVTVPSNGNDGTMRLDISNLPPGIWWLSSLHNQGKILVKN